MRVLNRSNNLVFRYEVGFEDVCMMPKVRRGGVFVTGD